MGRKHRRRDDGPKDGPAEYGLQQVEEHADGDWVVIQKKHSAHSGDIVVAQTEDGEATLKQWFPERDRIRLQPANTSMKPIYVKNARVLGVLAGVVRKT